MSSISSGYLFKKPNNFNLTHLDQSGNMVLIISNYLNFSFAKRRNLDSTAGNASFVERCKNSGGWLGRRMTIRSPITISFLFYQSFLTLLPYRPIT